MKLFRILFTLAHLGVIILLLLCTLNSVVPPAVFPYLNLLSLAFPALMIVNILLCLWWIIRLKKRALLFIGASLLLWNPTSRWLNYNDEIVEKPNLRVITMNVKAGEKDKTQLYNYFIEQNADIVLLQEYGRDFNIPGYKYNTNKHVIVALNSKYKIINTQKVATTGNGNSFFADIDVNGKVIRVINIYLNPFMFDKQKVKPSNDIATDKSKLKYVYRRLIPTFKIHQEEVADIRKAINDSPYPVLLGGDFNSVPNSYEYYHLAEGLSDAFVKVGRGSATTFHDYKFPIRIDYLFSSKEIEPISYRVDRSVKLSDHFPVIAEFKIN